jgi:hypothetical protein
MISWEKQSLAERDSGLIWGGGKKPTLISLSVKVTQEGKLTT